MAQAGLYVQAQFGDDLSGNPTASSGVIYDLKFDFPTQILQLTLVDVDALSRVLLVLGDDTASGGGDGAGGGGKLMTMAKPQLTTNNAPSTAVASGDAPSSASSSAASSSASAATSDAMPNVVELAQSVNELGEATRVGYRRYTLRGDRPFGIASLVIVQTDRSHGGDTSATDATAAQTYSNAASQPVFIAVACVAVLLSCLCGCIAAFLVIRFF